MNKTIRLAQFALLITFVALFVGFFAQSGITQSINITPPPGDKEIGGGVPIEEGDVLEAIPMTTRITWKDTDIYMRDLSMDREIQITKDFSLNDQDMPDIWGNKIVWMDDRNGNYDVYMYDLYLNKETQITTDPNDQGYPKIWNNRIVWWDWRNDNGDVYMYNLLTGQETRITYDGWQAFPDIAGNRIVWENDEDSSTDQNWDIYMLDLSTEQKIQITDHEGNQTAPVVYGDRIAWTDYRNDIYGDIYMFNLLTGRETAIAAIPGTTQAGPSIWGNKIVWMDGRNDNYRYDIYLYNIATATEFQITANEKMQYGPDIYGHKVVWIDWRNASNHVYMYDLSKGQETQINNHGPSESASIFAPLLFPIF